MVWRRQVDRTYGGKFEWCKIHVLLAPSASSAHTDVGEHVGIGEL